MIKYESKFSAFSTFTNKSCAFGSLFRPIFRACGAKLSGIIFPPEILAVGVGDMVGVGVMVAVGLAVGVGEGMSIIVGVGVGVMTVFCCSRVLVISVSCFRSTEDWEYIKMEADIPTPAKSKRMIVSSEDVGAFGRSAGMVAGCGSGFADMAGSLETVNTGGIMGGWSLTSILSKTLFNDGGALSLSCDVGVVGSSSGVGSNSGGVAGTGVGSVTLRVSDEF